MRKLPDYLIQFTKYKWEFLRRNSEYIKEYTKLQKLLDKRYGKYREYGPPEGLTHEEIDFAKKFHIFAPLHPGNSYDNFTNLDKDHHSKPEEKKSLERDSLDLDVEISSDTYSLRGGIDFHKLMYMRLNLPELLYDRPAKVLDGWAIDVDEEHLYIPRRLGEEGTLTIKIDMRYSKNRLMRELKFIIDDWKEKYEWKYKKNLYEKFCEDRNIHSFPINETLMKEFEKLYKKELKKRNEKYQQKFHFDNFDLYLQVYDLKKEGKSWSKITSALNLNSTQTARNHYRAACEIIEKGVEAYVQ